MAHSTNTLSPCSYNPRTINFFKEKGKAVVFSILDNKPIEITIEKGGQRYAGLTLNACLESCIFFQDTTPGKRCLGSIQVDWLRNFEDGTYGSERFGDIRTYNDYHYYGSAKKVDKIIVEFIESNVTTKYKGVGTALMQAAMEYGYLNHCDGSIHLSATWNSHGFYYKLGMRSNNEGINKWIKDNIDEGKREDIGSRMMYMPEEGKLKWREKIRTNPIFSETPPYLPPIQEKSNHVKI